MKRVLFVLLTFVLTTALLLPIAADYNNANYGRVNNFEGSIAQDGIKDEAYTRYGKNFVADAWRGFGILNSADRMDAWWVFTDNYSVLHIFTEVHDSVLITPPEEKHSSIMGCCHTDSVEIWIDPTNNAAENSAELIRQEAWHYRCDITGFNSAVLWGAEYLGNDACSPFFQTNVQITDYGYSIEWEIRTDAFSTPLQRGEKWGINMMMNDVYDIRHDADKPEHWNKPEYYFMTSYLIDGISYGPTIQPADFDYITLGNSVKPGDVPPEDPDDPNLGGDTNNNGSGTGNGSGSTNTNGGGSSTAPKMADGMLLSTALLVMSAAGAFVVIKRRNR